jgi:hypothetical protein
MCQIGGYECIWAPLDHQAQTTYVSRNSNQPDRTAAVQTGSSQQPTQQGSRHNTNPRDGRHTSSGAGEDEDHDNDSGRLPHSLPQQNNSTYHTPNRRSQSPRPPIFSQDHSHNHSSNRSAVSSEKSWSKMLAVEAARALGVAGAVEGIRWLALGSPAPITSASEGPPPSSSASRQSYDEAHGATTASSLTANQTSKEPSPSYNWESAPRAPTVTPLASTPTNPSENPRVSQSQPYNWTWNEQQRMYYRIEEDTSGEDWPLG